MKKLWPLFLVFCLFLFSLSIQGQDIVINETNLLQQVGRVSDSFLIKAIEMAKRIDIEDPQSLVEKGVSQEVVDALLKRKVELAFSSLPQAPAAASVEAKTTAGIAIPSEPGVYVETSRGFESLPVESASIKAPSIWGGMVTGMSIGLKKSKVKGQIRGARSPAQFSKPVSLILRGEEFPLVSLEANNKNRQFVTFSIGLTGSSNLGDSSIQIKTEKVGQNIYRVILSDIPDGEYGFISSQTPSGYKLYTFGVYGGSPLSQR